MLILFHLLEPKAKLPSRNDWGIALIASSVVLIIVGRIINPKVKIPTNKLLPNPKNNIKNTKPNKANTMEGVPFRLSIFALINLVILLFFAYSER